MRTVWMAAKAVFGLHVWMMWDWFDALWRFGAVYYARFIHCSVRECSAWRPHKLVLFSATGGRIPEEYGFRPRRISSVRLVMQHVLRETSLISDRVLLSPHFTQWDTIVIALLNLLAGAQNRRLFNVSRCAKESRWTVTPCVWSDCVATGSWVYCGVARQFQCGERDL